MSETVYFDISKDRKDMRGTKMSYSKLSKLYYEDENKWKNEYNKRFNSFSTQHFNFFIKEYNRTKTYQAFLCYTPEITNTIDSLYRLSIKLYSYDKLLPHIAVSQYIDSCMVEEIQATNEIEGVHSSRKEIREAMTQLYAKKIKTSRFHSIVEKYNKLKNREKIDFYTSQDVRNFYDDFILSEVINDNPTNKPDGKIFRKNQVEVTTSTQKIIHTGVYPEDKLIAEMDKALDLLNDNEQSLFIRLAIFHYLFGYLHPFYDGNGRMIRFITSYYIALDFSPIVAFHLSLYLKKHQKTYYEMFQETNSEKSCGDLGFFVTEFLNIIKNSLEEIISYLTKRTREYYSYIKKIQKLNLADELTFEIYHILLQASLFTPLGATMQEITSTINKSRNTVLKRLEDIPTSHILKDTSEKPHRFKLNLKAFE